MPSLLPVRCQTESTQHQMHFTAVSLPQRQLPLVARSVFTPLFRFHSPQVGAIITTRWCEHCDALILSVFLNREKKMGIAEINISFKALLGEPGSALLWIQSLVITDWLRDVGHKALWEPDHLLQDSFYCRGLFFYVIKREYKLSRNLSESGRDHGTAANQRRVRQSPNRHSAGEAESLRSSVYFPVC